MDLQDFSLVVGVRKQLEEVFCSHLKYLKSPPIPPEKDLAVFWLCYWNKTRRQKRLLPINLFRMLYFIICFKRANRIWFVLNHSVSV